MRFIISKMPSIVEFILFLKKIYKNVSGTVTGFTQTSSGVEGVSLT
jgi:hypothetical protein